MVILKYADRNNDRIAVYDTDGNFIQAITLNSYPSLIPLNKPMDLSFDNKGNIYIADSENDRIVILDKNHNYIGIFGMGGIGAGYLNKPEGIDLSLTAYH